jgi:L-rhamnose mutarotase
MTTQKHCFALDLKDDIELISAYKKQHLQVWPEIISSIKATGIIVMDLYIIGNRLFMIMEVDANFSFEKKAAMDLQNPVVTKWEELMWTFQQALPWATPGEKWMLMEKIFELP